MARFRHVLAALLASTCRMRAAVYQISNEPEFVVTWVVGQFVEEIVELVGAALDVAYEDSLLNYVRRHGVFQENIRDGRAPRKRRARPSSMPASIESARSISSKPEAAAYLSGIAPFPSMR